MHCNAIEDSYNSTLSTYLLALYALASVISNVVMNEFAQSVLYSVTKVVQIHVVSRKSSRPTCTLKLYISYNCNDCSHKNGIRFKHSAHHLWVSAGINIEGV